jgi:hypothetical protein
MAPLLFGDEWCAATPRLRGETWGTRFCGGGRFVASAGKNAGFLGSLCSLGMTNLWPE